MMKRITAADGHELECWMQSAKGTARGGLVILQEIFGVTDQLKGVARRYADLGYDVAIPALFDRQKRGAVVAFADAEVGRKLMLATKLDETTMDVAAAVAALKERSAKVAVMGFCWGGGLAIRAAQELDVAGAISFYGTRLPQYLDRSLKVPVLGHFGLKDDHVPPEMLKEAQERLPEMVVHTYDAGHAFANDARPAAYNRDAAELAHTRTERFLAEQLS